MFVQTHDQHAELSTAPVPEASGQHLLLYDGVCGLCDRTISFVLPRDPTGLFQFAALQSAFGRGQLRRHGRDPDQMDTFIVIENYRSTSPRLLDGARAALFVVEHLKRPWKYARLAKVLPNFILEAGYRLIARNRYFLFGKLDRCVLPESAYKDRFIDWQDQLEFRQEESLSSPTETPRSRGTRDPKTPAD